MQPIMNILRKLNLNIPVIVVTINKTESKELLGFDTSDSNLACLSVAPWFRQGTRNIFCSTTFAIRTTPGSKGKDYHFPIKVAFSSSQPEILEDVAVIKKSCSTRYINSSRMYWKSISQQNLPVTIKYPEMVAETYPFFQSDKLPPFGQKNLWFL